MANPIRKVGLVEEELTGAIIKAFYHVYNALGYGFLESIYTEGMARTLTKWGFDVQREVRIVIYLDGEAIGLQKVDRVVNGRVIVENKSTFRLSQADHRQLTS
jgi:GxxExxY protein